jgi:hypothetical protein
MAEVADAHPKFSGHRWRENRALQRRTKNRHRLAPPDHLRDRAPASFPIDVLPDKVWHMRMKAPASRTGVRALLVVTMAVALAVPGTASARLGSFHDAKDASTRLDLADVSLRHHAETHRYSWRFSTFERFRLANGGSILLLIDSVGTGHWDYRLHVWNDEGSGGVYCDGFTRPGAGGAHRFGPTNWDIQPRSGWCRFKGGRRDKSIRWRVLTVRKQQRPFGVALDRAPDTGWF